jgi:hypothetical protein
LTQIRHNTLPVFAVALAAAMGASAAHANDEFLNQYDDSATWTFVEENDLFADTDQNYTNGLRLAYVSGFKEVRGVSAFFAYRILGAGEDAGIRRGFAVGQSIFTPQDIAETRPLPDQHPYAGWLYGEYSAIIEQSDAIDQITIQAGLVGPAAGGEFVQNNWHSLIGAAEAQGWDNQIGNEPGLVLSYDHKFRALTAINADGFGADLTPSFGGSIGNIYTSARAGVTLRIGQDLRNDYGPPRIRPSLAGGGYFSPRDRFSWYVFAGLEARAVAHNIFLDGSLFRDDDPSVSSKVLTGDIQAGVVAQLRRIQLAYTYVVRAKEFDEQDEGQQFGAVSLSVKF